MMDEEEILDDELLPEEVEGFGIEEEESY